MVNVELAGFNVDRNALNEIKTLLLEGKLRQEEILQIVDTNISSFTPTNITKCQERLTQYRETIARTSLGLGNANTLTTNALKLLTELTPETISAAYARISRDPRPIGELRKDSRKDINEARKSNKLIVFTMGHKSIAEHTNFNWDIVGLSRRAVEELESGRLASYTEKSQRYITLDGDFVIPAEIKGTSLESSFTNLVELQNNFYKKKLPALIDWHSKQNYTELFKALGISTKPDKQTQTTDGLGKEDARYSLSQAIESQIGLTISGRNLETLISKLRSSNIAELQELGSKMHSEIDGIAPSVIKYTQADDYFSLTRPKLEIFVAERIAKLGKYVNDEPSTNSPIILKNGLKRDDAIIAGLIFSASDFSYNEALRMTQLLNTKDKFELLDQADEYQEKHDPKLREYELGNRVAEFTLSASAFAQIKRHRMDTVIPQRYLPSLGQTIPESVIAIDAEKELIKIVEESNKVYYKMKYAGIPRFVAEYALTNANKRRTLFDANNRQVHAFCMERQNLPAQWDIRNLADIYGKLIQQNEKDGGDSPITTKYLCGKHAFDDVKQQRYQ